MTKRSPRRTVRSKMSNNTRSSDPSIETAEISKPRFLSASHDRQAVGVTFFIFLLVRSSLLFIPSADDMPMVYGLIHGTKAQSLFDLNLPLNRLLVLPFFSLLDKIGIPSIVLGQLSLIPAELLLTLCLFLLFRLLAPKAPSWVISIGACLAGLHPGFFELHTYWVTRFNLVIAYGAIAFFLHVFPKMTQKKRVSLCALTTAITTLSYQGATNLFLAIVAVLLAYFVIFHRAIKDGMLLLAGVVLGSIPAAITLRALQSAGKERGNYFSPQKLGEIGPKIGRSFDRALNQIIGPLVSTNDTSRRAFVLLGVSLVVVVATILTRDARYLAFHAVCMLSIFVVSFQIPSLLFAYEWYPPRTFLFAFVPVAASLVVSGSALVERSSPFSNPYKHAYKYGVGALGVTLASTMLVLSFSVNTGYVTMRLRDLSTSTAVSEQLAEIDFDWKRPIDVWFGDWRRWSPSTRTAFGDMTPLLGTAWSAMPTVALVAGHDFISPSAEQQKKIADACTKRMVRGPEPEVIDLKDVVAVCV